MLFVICISLNEMICVYGLILTRYEIEVEGTNRLNISSFNQCFCQCLTSSNCSYFAYWSHNSFGSCQFYSSSEDKPNIVNYTLNHNDNETGLYTFSNGQCPLSISNSIYHYNTNLSIHNPLYGSRIISILLVKILNISRLLAIDDNDPSGYYTFHLKTFQVKCFFTFFLKRDLFSYLIEMIDNGTFLPSNGKPLSAREYSNQIYIGYLNNIIEVRQFISVGNSSKEDAQLLNRFSTIGGGPAECFVVLNINIIYYVTGGNILYILFTQSNISRQLETFPGINFASPSLFLALDSLNMELFLGSNLGRIFRIKFSSINIDNGTSVISSGLSDQYQMELNLSVSIYLDRCNRLWALTSTSGFQSEMILFLQGNKSFSSMKKISLTNSLPVFIYSPYSFILDDDYSLITANAHQGVDIFYRFEII